MNKFSPGDHYLELPAEEITRILRQRAVELARERTSEVAPTDTVTVVEFLLAHERYGIELKHVREIYPLKELWPLPWTPPFVLGLVNVRGQVLSLVDLKKFLGLPDKGLAERNCVLVVRNAQIEFGVLADEVLAVSQIEITAHAGDMPTLSKVAKRFVRGLSTGKLVVLDGEAILSEPSIVVHEEVV